MMLPINQIITGDCIEEMSKLPDGCVDMILTDPPYGTTACKWDTIIPLEPMWEQLKRVIKPNGAIVMTASQPFTTTLIASNMKMFKYDLVWHKTHPKGHLNAKIMPMRGHEDIVVFGKGKTTYNPEMRKGKYRFKGNKGQKKGRCYGESKGYGTWNDEYYPTSIITVGNANQQNKLHPTQKPVALMEYLIKTYTNEGELVLDFTCGSGTTCVAARNTGRDWLGIELSEEYCQIARERIEALVGLFK